MKTTYQWSDASETMIVVTRPGSTSYVPEGSDEFARLTEGDSEVPPVKIAPFKAAR